ncbi:MAG: stage III sporulation protein AF [Ruminococcus sp.]|nr:stage III sporulation protein AF [Ruminococcus sp.]
MNMLSASVVTACAVAVIGTLLSGFVTDAGTKKLLRMVLGAFSVCALILPVSQAIQNLRLETDAAPSYEELTATADEAFQKQVIRQTAQNLEQTLLSVLRQNNIEAERAEVILAVSDDNTVIISGVRIYISAENAFQTARIQELTEQAFQIRPEIITEYS